VKKLKNLTFLGGNFPNPSANQRWLTRPEPQKLNRLDPGQKILTRTHYYFADSIPATGVRLLSSVTHNEQATSSVPLMNNLKIHKAYYKIFKKTFMKDLNNLAFVQTNPNQTFTNSKGNDVYDVFLELPLLSVFDTL